MKGKKHKLSLTLMQFLQTQIVIKHSEFATFSPIENVYFKYMDNPFGSFGTVFIF